MSSSRQKRLCQWQLADQQAGGTLGYVEQDKLVMDEGQHVQLSGCVSFFRGQAAKVQCDVCEQTWVQNCHVSLLIFISH